MICPNPGCKRIVSPFDETCQHCGTSLKTNPVKDYAKKAGEIVNETEKRAEDIKEQIRGGFKEKGFSKNLPGASVSSPGAKRQHKPTLIQGDSSIQEQNNIQKPAKEIIGEAIDILKIKKKIEIQQQAFIDNMKHYVFTNPHVMNNDDWAAKGQRTYFHFDWENTEVNAGARRLNKEEIESSGGKYDYVIILFGGYVNFAYAVAAAFDELGRRTYDMRLLEKIITMYRSNKGNFDIYGLIDIFRQTQRDLDGMGADASKIIFECIAHEFGHICYGHIHGLGYPHQTKGENIGQEHDADSFAYAVIDASPSKKELWLGLIQFMIVRAVQEASYGKHEAKTHPLDIDRLKVAISRFPDLAHHYGIDEKWAEKTINQIYRWLS